MIVEGEDGYKAARGFMKLLMPSHVRRVKHIARPVPLFQRYGVEDQLSAMYQPVVQLKSGGYLVINPTEALVSIDINSGRSTREHNIEQTAFATNLEAAHEIARQLRLRDMAGLVVIDFIDMEQNSHVRKVEKAMKEALKNDRARIQVGRISSFGLMEMSRQRLRTGVLEASTKPCPHCEGTGLMRTAASAGLSALRMIEDEAARGRGEKILLRAGREAAVYVLNKKRPELADIEQRYGVSIEMRSTKLRGRADDGRELGPAAPAAPRPQPERTSIEEDLDEEIARSRTEADEDEERGRSRGAAEDDEGGPRGAAASPPPRRPRSRAARAKAEAAEVGPRLRPKPARPASSSKRAGGSELCGRGAPVEAAVAGVVAQGQCWRPKQRLKRSRPDSSPMVEPRSRRSRRSPKPRPAEEPAGSSRTAPEGPRRGGGRAEEPRGAAGVQAAAATGPPEARAGAGRPSREQGPPDEVAVDEDRAAAGAKRRRSRGNNDLRNGRRERRAAAAGGSGYPRGAFRRGIARGFIARSAPKW